MPQTRRAGRLKGRLLVIDFDFFFPNPARTTLPSTDVHLYDWGHQETILYRELIWPARAAAFTASGRALPRCTGLDGFWNRFQLNTATMLAADSNAFAGDLTPPGARGYAEVVVFDAHHDSGYSRTFHDFVTDGRYSCEDWTFTHFARGSRISVRYPPWLADWHREPAPRIPLQRATDNAAPIPGVFDTVFCCRSGSWIPPWCDEQWDQFLAEFPGDVHIIDPVLHRPRWNDQREHEYGCLTATMRAAVTGGPPHP